MKKIIVIVLLLNLLLSNFIVYGASSLYVNTQISGVSVKSVSIDMNNTNIVPVILNAGTTMNEAESLTSMAKKVGAFAAINGTYFEAYNGAPTPWGTIIKEGKIIHISNGGSVVGIKGDGKLIIDRLSFEFKGYINGVYRSIPWRINHPSTEQDAITIFTPEYGGLVSVETGAKAAVIRNGKVSEIASSNFYVPNDGFAILYNSKVSYLVDERFKVGDEVYYEVIIKTTYTTESDWKDVMWGLGAGPSLIINGNITADGVAEGFFEDKINKNAAGRSFIGATSDGKIVMGNMGAVTVKQAAEIAKEMGLVNAMCLDGGGSIALYYPSSGVSMTGRNINNGLAFIELKGTVAKRTSSEVFIDGENRDFEAYNINDNNYFKLRDVALALNEGKNKFNVTWDNDRQAINLITDKKYDVVGGELQLSKGNRNKNAVLSSASIYVNGEKVNLTAYNINGNNYFKLRDLGAAIGFNIEWDAQSNNIIIKTK